MKHNFYEHYTVATLLQRGFNATLVDFPYADYGILIEESDGNFLRLHAKSVNSGRISLQRYAQVDSLDSRVVATRYTVEDCDCIVAVGVQPYRGGDLIDYYVIPTIWTEQVDQLFVATSEIPGAKNNFELLHKCRDKQFVFESFADVEVNSE